MSADALEWLLSQGSQAYAKALSKAGILTDSESETIVEGLEKVRPQGEPPVTMDIMSLQC